MKTTIQNKLVRDNIPSVLRNLGIEAEVEEIKDEVRYTRLLLDYLAEKAQNAGIVLDDTIIEELADLESIIDSILNIKGLTREELKKKQDEKDIISGKFDKRFFLKQTRERISS